jgi:hypothetical protein
MRKAATIVVLLISLSVRGQQTDFFKPGPVRRELKALPITGNIRIDGLLDEPEWTMTPGAADFIQVEPNQGHPSDFVTIVKVLYNQKYLYISCGILITPGMTSSTSRSIPITTSAMPSSLQRMPMAFSATYCLSMIYTMISTGTGSGV